MFAEFVMPGLFDGIALRDRQHGDGGRHPERLRMYFQLWRGAVW
jgi:predicted Zn-dependent protease with MMP-like domain